MFADSAHYYQLIAAILFGIVLFVGANIASEKTVLTLLVLLIPFQIIDSRYGSLNVVLTYAVGLVFLVRGKIKYFPLAGAIGFIAFAYLLSLSQIPKGTFRDQAVFLFSVGSNFLLFFIVYNAIRRMGTDGPAYFWKLLIYLNVLVLGYCTLQLAAGLTGRVSFGLEELTLLEVRGEHRRLTGPFNATAMTAEYLCIQIMIAFYSMLHENNRAKKNLLWLLFLLNAGFLVTTGNRGGIVILVLGFISFLYIFRKELGTHVIMKFSFGGVLLFAIISVLVVQYTDFNVLFERLENTEIEGVVPDSRQGWKDLLPIVLEKPILGHGPRLKMSNETYEAHRNMFQMPQPHNAAMYLMYTIGVVGLMAYLIFFTKIFIKFMHARYNATPASFSGGIPRVGIVILIIIAASQLRMEMFRFNLNDYQQYIMMLMGGLLATLATLTPSTVSSTNSRLMQVDNKKQSLINSSLRET